MEDSAGELETVRLLLQNPDIDPNTCRVHARLSLFSMSCLHGKVEIVKLMMADERVDVNVPDSGNNTPLLFACQSGKSEVVSLLMQNKKVDVNKANNQEMTPFGAACGRGHIQVVKLMMADERVDVNKKMSYEFTPLYVACLNGDIEIVKLLINDERVDVNAADNEGVVPLHVACIENHAEVVKTLMENPRVNVNKGCIKGLLTPLDFAYLDSSLDAFKWLLSGIRQDVKTVLKADRGKGDPRLEALMCDFETDQEETQLRLKKELGIV